MFIGLLMTPTAALARTGGIKSNENSFIFDRGRFETEIRRNFVNKTMGYQVILIKDGVFVAEVAGGLARNPIDGGDEMTLDTPANIGSTVKFFAGTALLQKLQQKAAENGTMNMWLARKVFQYFPKVWQEGMHESIKQITLRDLLQHKGGFIHNDSGMKVFFDYLAKGVSSDQTQSFAYGKRRYANANITAIGYVLAAIDNPQFLQTIDQIIASKNLQADDPLIQTMLGNAFEAYMKNRIFSKVQPAIAPTCDAPAVYAQKNIVFAHIYALPTTSSTGIFSSSKTNGGACHAAGGWYISGRELATYVANFSATDTIVNAATRDLMFDDDAPENQMVWSHNTSSQLLLKNFQWNSTPFMGGDWGGHATIVQLPNGYYAVGITNSGILNDQGAVGNSFLLTRNIIQAFNYGVDANF